MMGGHSMQPGSFPGTLLPPPGTAAATARRNAFISSILDICGDVRLLWLPSITDTTTTTDASRNARTFTYDATIASRLSVQGSGVWVSFNGTDQYAEVADADNLSFGDGANDSPFSILALVNQTGTATTKTVISKIDQTTAATKKEWWMYFDNDEALTARYYDDSANTYVGCRYNTGLATATPLFVAQTYDGTRDRSGVTIYSAAARIDDTLVSSGTYVGQENTASTVRLGCTMGTAARTEFFNGSMAMVCLCAKALNEFEMWSLKSLINGFYGLSL